MKRGHEMSRQGRFVTNLEGKLVYKSFQPSTLPPQPDIQLSKSIQQQLIQTYVALGKLEGLSLFMHNTSLLMAMYMRKEALLSSQIEGTQATLDDLLDPHIDVNINNDIKEVLNYTNAYEASKTLLERLPISIRYIKELHHILLTSNRGREKEPGFIRHTQNWIGPLGSTIQTATFVPPNINDMNEALASLESFIHQEDMIDPIIKIGLIHYQFETIHPFLDGNGRIGRLLIPILLKYYRVFEADALYVSYYFKKHQHMYYDKLMRVRETGDYENFLSFFIDAILHSANHGIQTNDRLLQLKDQDLLKIQSRHINKKDNILMLFEYIHEFPILDIKKTSKYFKKSFNTIASWIHILIDLNILVENTSKKRYRIFYYKVYLDILRDGL